MTAACCGRRDRADRHVVDRVVVDRAVNGQRVDLSPAEFELVAYRLKRDRRWGLSQIAAHTGYSRSQVAATLAKQRKAGEA